MDSKKRKKITSILTIVFPPLILILISAYFLRGLFLENGVAFFVDTAPFHLNMTSLHSLATNLWVERYAGAGIYSSLPAYIQNFFALDKIYSFIYLFIRNQSIISTLWVYLPYPFFLLSVYFFVKHFAHDRFVSLISALIYLFSYIYFMWFIHSGSNILVWAVGGAIWFCYSFIKILEAESTSDKIKYSLIGLLSSLLAIANIAYFFVFIIFLGLYYFFNLLNNDRKTNKKQLKNGLIWASLIFAGNSFWILPTILLRGGGALNFGGAEDLTLVYHSSCATAVRNIMYMFCGLEPSRRIFYSALYLAIFGIITYFVFKKKDSLLQMFLSSFMVFYVISLGLNTPAWKIISRIPGAFLLRTPQRVYEVMLLIFVTMIAIIITKYKSRLLLVLSLLLILVSAAPNEYISSDGFGLKKIVPNSYKQAQEFLQKDGDNSRILIYPAMPAFLTREWDNQKLISPPIIDYFLNERLVMFWLKGDNLPEEFKPFFKSSFWNDLGINKEKVLGLFNIKYILYQNDIRTEALPPMAKESLEFSKEVTGNNLALDTKELKIFKTQDKYFYPIIYAPKKTLKDNDDIYKTITSSSEKIAIVENDPRDYPEATIDFNKITSSKYFLKIKGRGNRTVIVFQEKFHPGWSLFSSKKDLEKFGAKQIKANGFENGWEINLDETCKKIDCERSDDMYELNLEAEFVPQKLLSFLLPISYLLIIGLSVSFFLLKIKDGEEK